MPRVITLYEVFDEEAPADTDHFFPTLAEADDYTTTLVNPTILTAEVELNKAGICWALNYFPVRRDGKTV